MPRLKATNPRVVHQSCCRTRSCRRAHGRQSCFHAAIKRRPRRFFLVQRLQDAVCRAHDHVVHLVRLIKKIVEGSPVVVSEFDNMRQVCVFLLQLTLRERLLSGEVNVVERENCEENLIHVRGSKLSQIFFNNNAPDWRS